MSFATDDIVIDLNGSSTFLGTGSVVNVEGFVGLTTGSGNDTLTSTAAALAETIDTGAGNDTITLQVEALKTVEGGSGDDRLVLTYTDNTAVTVTGFSGSLAAGYSGTFDGTGAQNAVFSGIESFTYTHTTGTGVDNITTGDGNDVFATGADNDVIHSGGGIDVVDGGAGNDRWGADMSFATDDIVIDLNGSSTFLGTGSAVNVEGFDGLTTGSGNDQLTSTAAAWPRRSIAAPATTRSRCMVEAAKTVAGGSGNDRLVLTYTDNSGVTLTALTGSLAAGYSGIFDGPAPTTSTSPGSRASPSPHDRRRHRHHHDRRRQRRLRHRRRQRHHPFGRRHRRRRRRRRQRPLGRRHVVRDPGHRHRPQRLLDLPRHRLGGQCRGLRRPDDGLGQRQLTSTAAALAETIDTGAGNDTITLQVEAAKTVAGGSGDDRLVLNYIDGGVTLNAPSGDLATGYSGLFDGAGSQNVTFSGIESFTYTNTGIGIDTITTGDGNDVFATGAGNDIVNAAGGDDSMKGGDGNDTLDGGAGTDTADYSDKTTAVAVTLNGATNATVTVNGVAEDTIRNVENLIGGTAGDTLTGDTLANRLDGGAGADTLAGGTGDDTYVVDDAGDTTTEAADAGTDTVESSITHTLAADVENLTLTGSATINGTGNGAVNAITGNSAANQLSGLAGNDTLTGFGGNDRLDGGADADTMTGGPATTPISSTMPATPPARCGATAPTGSRARSRFTLAAGIENLMLTGPRPSTAPATALPTRSPAIPPPTSSPAGETTIRSPASAATTASTAAAGRCHDRRQRRRHLLRRQCRRHP